MAADAGATRPVRCLHLIHAPHAGPDLPRHAAWHACHGALAACAAVARQGPSDHRVVLLGDSAGRRLAQRTASLRIDRSISPPLGIPRLAWSALRRERAWRPDEVHLWSPGLVGLSRILAPARPRRTPWAQEPRSPAPEPWLTGSSGVRADPMHRRSTRASLGLSDRTPLIVLLADPPRAGDARRFAFGLGLAEVGVGIFGAVVGSGSDQLDRARRFHRLAARRSPLHVVEGSTLPWLPAADVAVLHGRRGPGSLAAARTAIRLGIPLVGPEWLADEAPALVGSVVFTTDGRARSLLPALLLALRAAKSGKPGADEDPEHPDRIAQLAMA